MKNEPLDTLHWDNDVNLQTKRRSFENFTIYTLSSVRQVCERLTRLSERQWQVSFIGKVHKQMGSFLLVIKDKSIQS